MKLKRLLSVITVIFLLVVIGRAVHALIFNYGLTKNFIQEAEDYDPANVEEVERLLPNIEALIAYEYTNVLKSPVTIRYYEEIGDSSPAYVIEKGERIYVFKDSDSSSVDIDGCKRLADGLPLSRGYSDV